MKKIIYSSIIATLSLTAFCAEDQIGLANDNSGIQIENTETQPIESDNFDVKSLSLRFALPVERVRFENGNKIPIKKYLIGFSLCGNVEDHTNMIGFFADPWVAGNQQCFMDGISLASVGQFHTVNGVSMNLLSSYHKEINGFVAGTLNFNDTVNGVVFSTFGNIDEKVNGVACALWMNNHKEMNGLALSFLCNGGFKDLETERESFFYERSELNGIACGFLGNVYEDIDGIVLSLFGNYAQQATGIMGAGFNVAKSFTGYQIGGINLNASTDTCLQAAFLNSSHKTKNTLQFGFWNEIKDFDSYNNMQFGLINRSNSECFQIGLLNFSEKGFFKFFPFINF